MNAPRWFQKFWEFIFPYEIEFEIRKKEKPRGKIVQGSFNKLFSPGLRREFIKEYESEYGMMLTPELVENDIKDVRPS